MAFYYTESVVLWTYHQENPSDNNPSMNDLSRWDRDLVQSYEGRLRQILPENNIPVTRETKSRILLLATVSNGGTVETQIRNACEYYVNAWNMDLDLV
jgi:hypothetical protein